MPAKRLRVISLNVNGIRSAHAKGFWTWAKQQEADVICVQEIKAHEDLIPLECRNPVGYHAFFHPAIKPGYSGVGIITRKQPERVIVGMAWKEMDDEGRYLQADFGRLSVVSLYLPSGSSGEARQQVKFRFLERFGEHLDRLRSEGRDYILCGDWNIAHKELDLKNWKSNQKNSGFLPEERQWFDRLLGERGYVDAFRVIHPDTEHYTWWSNRGRAYEKNVGWRIDYHIVTPGLRERIRSASIYKDEKFSDHAPLTIDYEWGFD